MKKQTQLAIKKVTLSDLDKPVPDAIVAGGASDIYTSCESCFGTCVHTVCGTCVKCG